MELGEGGQRRSIVMEGIIGADQQKVYKYIEAKTVGILLPFFMQH